MATLLLALLACAHHPPAASEPSEAELRRVCETRGEHQAGACGYLMVQLENGGFGSVRSAEALALAERTWKLDGALVRLGLAIAQAHPELPTSVDFVKAACESGVDYVCDGGGDAAFATDPTRARALWQTACARGDAWNTWMCGRTAPLAVAPDIPEAFAERLRDVHASIHLPAGYHAVPVAPSEDFEADYAVMSDDGALEVRYAIRDMSGLAAELAEVTARGGTAASLSNIERAQITIALANVGTRGPDEVTADAFPKAGVRVEFNANWGVSGATTARESFSADGAVVAVVFLHREPATDLYIFTIFHDPAAKDARWGETFHSLRFDDPVGLGGSWG